MRPVLRALLAAVPLAATLTGLTASAAQAQPAHSAWTWTVTPGGRFSGGAAPFHLDSYLADTVTGAKFTCFDFSFGGHLWRGTDPTPSIGRILGVAFADPGNLTVSCKGNGLSLAVNSADTPWPMRATYYDPPNAWGEITNVDIVITSNTCTASLTGQFHWSYNNGADINFTAPKTLTAANVTGCTGVINNGDAFTFTAHASPVPPRQSITAVS